MKIGTFTSEVNEEKKIQIPREVYERLRIEPGDQVEITLKKIKVGRLDLLLSKNPLYKLLDLAHPDKVGEE